MTNAQSKLRQTIVKLAECFICMNEVNECDIVTICESGHKCCYSCKT
jgi:hypothetical protein